MSIYINKKKVGKVVYNKKFISAIYYGKKLVWTAISKILSCYSNGYWMDEYPWKDDQTWKD